MKRYLAYILNGNVGSLRAWVIGIYLLLFLGNVAAWTWAVIAFRYQPVLLGTALLAYGFGLRHAVDADHIAAIDNVTRKLMQDSQRPVSVGLFFALGHSAVVMLVVAAIAASANALKGSFEGFRDVGGVVATVISSLFLFLIAAINLMVLLGVWRTYRYVRAGGVFQESDLDILLNQRGLLSRVFRPMFHLITRSWHMFPLGFLFGLGFDTATEISVVGISGTEVARGVSIWAIMVFPALFAAGMTLVDTTDGILMLGAYNWAFVKPIRKLYYNLTITSVSVVVAIVIGSIESLQLIGEQLGLTGAFWNKISLLIDNFNNLGFVIIGLFFGCWVISAVIYRIKGLDEVEVRSN
jgi:nickel/cobalt transporter (NiCoT) family protein